MAEAAPRASGHRGRGSTRAGRGGHSSRGGRSSVRTNGDTSAPEVSLDEQGELGQLKKQYLPQISTLKEMFPDWTDDDLVFALQESDGDLSTTIDRITEGNVSQFSDVKKKTREKSRPKIPDAASTSTNDKSSAGRGRGSGRGGSEAGRGGRGRTTERGRGGRGGRSASRGGAAAVTATTTAPGGWDADASKPETTTAWDDAKPQTPDLPADGSWAATVTSEVQTAATAVLPEAQKSSVIPEGTKKSWASIAQPKPPPAVPKAAPPPKVKEPKAEAVPEPKLPSKTDPDSLTPTAAQRVPSDYSALTPPRDKLTEDNVEQLPDASIPAATETVASTRDPGSIVGSTTPSLSNIAAQQQTPSSAKQPLGGYATTAWKAAGGLPGRSASFQRRILEQQEAVVLPGNHAVDRAAVQFGSMNLSSDADAKPLDIDDDREEPETRAQPPQQSPSAPRTSLPPSAPQIPTGPDSHLGETIPTPKPAPGLTQPGQLPHGGPGGIPHNYNQQYARYGSSAVAQENINPQQKPYDSYGQHAAYSQPEQSGAYPSQTTTSSGLPQASQLGSIGGAQADYGSADNTRAQQSYYGSSYGQPGAPGLQDQGAPPQRTASGFGASDSGYSSNQQAQSRFGESQNSGHTTPNPTSHASSQVPQQHQQQQHHHMQSQHHAQGGWGSGYGQYPYNYNNPQYSQYMSQYGNAYGGYGQQYGGGPYGGKGYGQQHHGGYGMPPQGGYEHSSSPANVGGYGSSLRGSDSGLSGGLGDYNRSGSTQGAQTQHSAGAGGLGGVGDTFGRSSSGLGHQGYGQQTSAPADESIKAYADSKTGPSPSLGQPGRTGSALGNSSQYGGQSGFPPGESQQQQQGFPSHLNQYGGSSYGLGGIGGQGSGQGHQGSGFSGYGGFSGSGYGSGYGGRGWSNYQQSGGYSQH